MFTASTILFLHAETSVHVGSGESHGAVDLAIQREQHTGFPVAPASGVKGAVRSWFADQNGATDRHTAAFGPDTSNAGDHAGAIAFTDARLLLFPVQSMTGVFAWTTCPSVLRRLQRDLDAVGHTAASWDVPSPDEDEAIGTEANVNHTSQSEVLLEERHFAFKSSKAANNVALWLNGNAIPGSEAYDYWSSSTGERLLILHDDAFRDLVQHATEVQARVKLNEQGTTGEDGNLFYQENLPSDALLYAQLLAQDDLSGALGDGGGAEALLRYIRTLDGNRLQIGGDASVGRGLTRVHFLGSDEEDTE